MKKHQPTNKEEFQKLIEYLNYFHDASIKKICFTKDRNINQEGDLILPGEDAINGDVEIEFILNSYQGAKRDQIVVLHFYNVRVFKFYQDVNFDYSDIYELKMESGEPGLILSFYSTMKKIKSLLIGCTSIVCVEK